jgi:hypothetical protein
MNFRLLIVSTALVIASGCAPTATTARSEHNHAMPTASGLPKYNTTTNPRQTEHPNTLGFNDLHIQAIRLTQQNGEVAFFVTWFNRQSFS